MTIPRNTVIEKMIREQREYGVISEAEKFFQQPGIQDEIIASLKDAQKLNRALSEGRKVDDEILNRIIDI